MNLSNSISLLRIILTFPVAYFIYAGEINIAIIIGVIAGLTDFLDGFFARKLNQITDLGKILDPVADKVFVGVIALVMILTEAMPVWFFLAVILRDLLILAGGLYLKKKYEVVPTSNFEGKVTFFLIVITMLGVVLEFNYAIFYGFYLCTAALIYSFGTYIQRMMEIIKENRLSRN
ncbi:MAG: CDP-alcohol phosphatidyltransferase family protein [Candidatus Kapabacteria bacterium]|nr:CDP-alcohol phosphatidyltransferase family protein [Ignavibacteriota bacterium]MCW5885574.1 CDP-alcohol phosphatidyltransferase family protein [Candidatus Kapabacteria bacterium]